MAAGTVGDRPERLFSQGHAMMRRDLEILAKSTLILAMTVGSLEPLFSSTVPKGISMTSVLVGRLLLSVIFSALVLATDFLLLFGGADRRPRLQLLPQTQLVLWIVGMGATMLATGGLRWFEPAPSVAAWALAAILLTFSCQDGFRWLWQEVMSTWQGPSC